MKRKLTFAPASSCGGFFKGESWALECFHGAEGIEGFTFSGAGPSFRKGPRVLFLKFLGGLQGAAAAAGVLTLGTLFAIAGNSQPRREFTDHEFLQRQKAVAEMWRHTVEAEEFCTAPIKSQKKARCRGTIRVSTWPWA